MAGGGRQVGVGHARDETSCGVSDHATVGDAHLTNIRELTMADAQTIQPNAQNRYEVTRADLPLHCPMDGMSLWNSHPRVFLPIEKTGEAKCPYCGADYVLKDD